MHTNARHVFAQELSSFRFGAQHSLQNGHTQYAIVYTFWFLEGNALGI